MSAFTEPLAQVREALSYPRPSYAHTGQYLGRKDAPKQVTTDALAALDRIERLAEEMERQRDEIAKFALSHSGRDGQDVLLSALYRIGEECERDALSAREEGAQEKHTASDHEYQPVQNTPSRKSLSDLRAALSALDGDAS